MIDGLRPYPEMRESGVSWLGKVPVAWKVVRNGGLFAQRNETGFADLPIMEVSLKTGVRLRKLDDSDRKQVMADREKYKRACRGDLAYNMMRLWQGAIGVSPVDGLVSPAYVVARPYPGVESKFFEYLYRTDAYMGEVDKFSHGIVRDRNRLYWEEFKQMPSPMPPPDDQAAIVRFLDHAGRLIRRYIRSKQILIKLLEEQKQATIHRAVTRGLDPDVRLKPSGVEWLGEVPDHWEVGRLKTRLRRNDAGAWGTDFSDKGTVVLRSTEQTADGGWKIDAPARRQLSEGERHATLLRTGDLVVTKSSGSPAHIGKASLVTPEIETMRCGFSNFMQRLRPTWRVYPQFLWLFLNNRAGRDQLVYYSSTTTGLANLSGTILGNLWMAFPPRDEQEKLCLEVGVHGEGLRDAIGKARDGIALLNEYRTRLIYDVITGRLDVREAAGRLPDEAEESEAVDQADAFAVEVDAAANGLGTVPEEAEE